MRRLSSASGCWVGLRLGHVVLIADLAAWRSRCSSQKLVVVANMPG